MSSVTTDPRLAVGALPRRGRVTAGRVMAGGSILLAAYAVSVLVAVGSADWLTGFFVAHFALAATGLGVLAWLAIPRQPDNGAVWVSAWTAVLFGLGIAGMATAIYLAKRAGVDVRVDNWSLLSPADVPRSVSLSFMSATGVVTAPFLILTLGLLLFPDGEVSSPRWRWVAWVSVVAVAVIGVAAAWKLRPGAEEAYGDNSTYFALNLIYMLATVLAAVCIVSLVLRYRRSTGESRQQYRSILWGGGAFLLLFVLGVGENLPAWQVALALLGVGALVASYGVAVTRYRLYDIDLVISRTFVYGTLAAFIGAVYVIVVVGIGGALGAGAESLPLAIAATALVAVAFEPVRRAAQRWANRLVYGKRATPYEVLSNLTRRLAGTEPSRGILSRMAQLIAEGTGAEQATVWLAGREARLVAAAGWPQVPAPVEAQSLGELAGFVSPVVHDGELVGALEVTKARGNPVTPTEKRLIGDLAGSTGMVLGNQRLNAALEARAVELQESRRRLVEMQDAERRRLERDLHDGAQQQVVALKLKIGLAEHVARKEGHGELADTLRNLAEEAQGAVDEVRSLAKGIYPPLLESENLEVAIRAQVASWPVPVEVESTELGRYPKDVESAVYFAALEAVANAVRHGAASRVLVALSGRDSTLDLAVSDDGAGFDPSHPHEGTGLLTVKDRVEALGGELHIRSTPARGTTVSLSIPLDGVLVAGSG